MNLKAKCKSTIFLFLFIAILMLLFKIVRLHTLAYYIDDFSNNLESTYSWMLGRPVSYANGLGVTNFTHNYFLMPLLGPITYFGGPIGIFILQIALFFICWNNYLRVYPFSFIGSKLLFIFIFLSPTLFWIFDDPGVGWTVELLFLPFSILLALSLKSHKYNWAIFWAILMATVREDGIVMCSFIHITYLIFYPSKKFSILSLFMDKKIVMWTIFYISIFGLSMAYLHYYAPKATFFESAMASLAKNFQNNDFQQKNAILFFKALLMLSPFGFLLAMLTNWNKEKLLIFVGINLLLLLVNFIQGARYFDKEFFETISITWVPRFILPYSFSLAFLLLVVDPQSVYVLGESKIKKMILAILFVIQIPILTYCRDDINYKSILKSIITRQPDVSLKELVQENDLKTIRKIESIIPKRSSVYAFDYVIPIFLNHFIVWSDRNNNQNFNYENADIAIIPSGDNFVHMRNELIHVMKPNYKKVISFGAYDIYATEKYGKILMAHQQDLIQTSK
jgi:hypothetical protein